MTGSKNRIYCILNPEKTGQQSSKDYRQLSSNNVVPFDDSNICHPKKQSLTLPFGLNKYRTCQQQQQRTKTIYSNHERLSIQTPDNVPSISKNTPVKITTSVSKPSRVRNLIFLCEYFSKTKRYLF